ncbi:hypothetical protein [Coraliomargarita parva]|nr:hypothetical protein [Coraliomargarita parva]
MPRPNILFICCDELRHPFTTLEPYASQYEAIGIRGSKLLIL